MPRRPLAAMPQAVCAVTLWESLIGPNEDQNSTQLSIRRCAVTNLVPFTIDLTAHEGTRLAAVLDATPSEG
jgi:hypothetical protein